VVFVEIRNHVFIDDNLVLNLIVIELDISHVRIFRQCLLYFHVSLPRCVVVDSSIGIKVWLEMLTRVGTYKNDSTQSPFYGGSTWSFKAKAYALGLTFDGLEVVGAEGCIVKLMCTGIRLDLA